MLGLAQADFGRDPRSSDSLRRSRIFFLSGELHTISSIFRRKNYPKFYDITHSHRRTVVRECCKDDDQCQWERPKFDPPPQLNPLTDRHQNLPTWLRHGYLPSCKISSRSDRGFCFCACAISRIKLFTRLFFRFLGGFFISSTAKTPARILTQNTSKDAVPRKNVPFGGRKTKS